MKWIFPKVTSLCLAQIYANYRIKSTYNLYVFGFGGKMNCPCPPLTSGETGGILMDTNDIWGKRYEKREIDAESRSGGAAPAARCGTGWLLHAQKRHPRSARQHLRERIQHRHLRQHGHPHSQDPRGEDRHRQQRGGGDVLFLGLQRLVHHQDAELRHHHHHRREAAHFLRRHLHLLRHAAFPGV